MALPRQMWAHSHLLQVEIIDVRPAMDQSAFKRRNRVKSLVITNAHQWQRCRVYASFTPRENALSHRHYLPPYSASQWRHHSGRMICIQL